MNKHFILVWSAVLAGLTLLVSGTGKLPGQTEFIDVLLKSFWTPPVAYFTGYYLPWIEVCLGVFLIFGLFPRIAAALCVPLIIGFLMNNSWALINGVEKFPECAYCLDYGRSFSEPSHQREP